VIETEDLLVGKQVPLIHLNVITDTGRYMYLRTTTMGDSAFMTYAKDHRPKITIHLPIPFQVINAEVNIIM
jgi:hypothetical protein